MGSEIRVLKTSAISVVMNTGDLHKVWEIKALKRKPGEEDARKILEKIAKQVQPIMRNHKWRVKVLSEFCPKNPSLLGLNVGGGVHVKLRLRRHNRDWDFIPYDQVLDTMLHELCHNAHGPHNASFYKLWDELRKECEDLMNKGITGSGEGFDLQGRRLGGFSLQPPLSSLKKTALAAAEKRSRLGTLLPSGPNRLGGDSSIMGALSPIQAAAMAAERRLQDDIWCGSQHSEVLDQEESNEDSFSEFYIGSKQDNFVDLTASDSLSRKRSREPDDMAFSEPNNGYKKSGFVDLSRDASTSKSMCGIEVSSKWECQTCTLLNPPLAPICELCSTQKPKEVEIKYKLWSCKFCTLENSVKLDKCAACDQWRYSHGPPILSSTQYFNT